MSQSSTLYVGMDVHKESIAVVYVAKAHDAEVTFLRLRSVPGMGQIVALVRREERHDIHRFPRGHDCVSYGRLVTCAQASAGKRYGPSGKHLGHASLQWAFAEAAVRFRRHHPAGQTFLAIGAHRHGQDNALTVPAHKLARAVYDLLNRQPVCELAIFLQREREPSGGAWRLTGHPGEEPASSARSVLLSGVMARHGAPRPRRSLTLCA